MYAIFVTGGKQYRATEGDTIYVEKLEGEVGQEVVFDQVLLVGDKVGTPFVEGAKECGLEILPYRDGFFTSIPCDNPMKACEELAKENLYLVPLKMGLRFAVCAVEESKCKKAPAIIKEVLDRI